MTQRLKKLYTEWEQYFAGPLFYKRMKKIVYDSMLESEKLYNECLEKLVQSLGTISSTDSFSSASSSPMKTDYTRSDNKQITSSSSSSSTSPMKTETI